jgi:predicted heme/steroid binding protein
MTRGALHYGVKQSYIDWLLSLEVQPRSKPQDFLKLDVPENLPTMTYEELAKGDGNDGNPILLALNGKVLQYDESYPYIKNIMKGAGGHVEKVISKLLYEPIYGAPEKIKDFKREHCAYIEDNISRMQKNDPKFKTYIKVVALID